MTSPTRLWLDIARELASEQNRERVTQLAEELNKALEEQTLNKLEHQNHPSSVPEKNP